ncbi:MAG TPA: hypothetical protein VGK87_01650 [Anaerolineae bacterium]|jgi:hypothetical protein
MKYTFVTSKNEKVELDRSLLNGKVKVSIDGRPVGSSHQGMRGATGTFYPIKSGTLEVRSSLFELVPSVWYNEDWVDLVPPLTWPQYLLIGLPFVTATVASFGQVTGIVIGAIAVLICVLVMRSQRPAKVKVALCAVMAIVAPVAGFAATIALTTALTTAP